MNKTMFALIAGLAAAGAAQAQGGAAPQAYIGIGASQVDYLAEGSRTNPRLFAGYEFDRNWGVEAGYTYLDRRTWQRSDATRSIRGSTKGHDSYVAARYNVPLTERFSAYGKLGLSHSGRQYDNDTGAYHNDTDTGAYASVGVQYRLTQNLALNAEYERYGRDKPSGAKADAWSAGVRIGF
ncbi:porin family protein [Massilia niastensis]|uniref:porin family protein n=1 Tax=Massilia niastensis TaxID=544911 RepID=UPI00036ECDFF|nr:porin family protein [Massilia niastensis]